MRKKLPVKLVWKNICYGITDIYIAFIEGDKSAFASLYSHLLLRMSKGPCPMDKRTEIDWAKTHRQIVNETSFSGNKCLWNIVIIHQSWWCKKPDVSRLRTGTTNNFTSSTVYLNKMSPTLFMLSLSLISLYCHNMKHVFHGISVWTCNLLLCG